jgi:hypothetical protein
MSSEDVADWGRRQEIHQVRISVLSIGIPYCYQRQRADQPCGLFPTSFLYRAAWGPKCNRRVHV